MLLCDFYMLKMEDFDQTRFMAQKCHTQYYAYLPKTKILLEIGICLVKVLEKIPTFHGFFAAIGLEVLYP